MVEEVIVNPENTDNLIKKAEEAALRLEEANKRREEILKQEEDLYARQLISGRSNAAAAPTPAKPHDEQVKEEVNKMFKQLSPFNK